MLWCACLFTHTQTHTLLLFWQSWWQHNPGSSQRPGFIYKRLYKLAFNRPSQTGSEVVGMGIPGVKMAGVEAARRDSAVPPHRVQAELMKPVTVLNPSQRASFSFTIWLPVMEQERQPEQLARSGINRRWITKPVKICQYIYCCRWLDSNMLIILPSNHFFVFGSKILPSVQMRGFFFL